MSCPQEDRIAEEETLKTAEMQRGGWRKNIEVFLGTPRSLISNEKSYEKTLW